MNDTVKFVFYFLFWLTFTIQLVALTWTLQDIRDILRTIAGKK